MTASVLVIDRSVCGGAAGVIKSVSTATLLLPPPVLRTPGGAVTVATLLTAPVAVGLRVAVTV